MNNTMNTISIIHVGEWGQSLFDRALEISGAGASISRTSFVQVGPADESGIPAVRVTERDHRGSISVDTVIGRLRPDGDEPADDVTGFGHVNIDGVTYTLWHGNDELTDAMRKSVRAALAGE